MISLRTFLPIFLTIASLHTANGAVVTPDSSQIVRLSKLEIDPAQVENYKSILKEEIEDSMRLEPGVLTLYAVFEKKKPNSLTILEIYVNQNAYLSHIKTPHFLKYKTSTRDMILKLELIDTDPLIPNLKIK
jgi:quinol monooxygenase YgiN